MAPTRIEIGSVNDLLKDGQMKEVAFPTPESETKILLSRVGGTYYATSNKCTHYGAPLIKGVLTESGRVVCPWHGACFDVCTGDIEDSPGMNSLHTYKVETEKDVLFVTPPADLESLKSQRVPSVTISTKATAPGVIVIGGGAAAAHGVEALREQGYKGRIQVFSSEKYLPIDRTKLSKGLMPVPDKILLRSAEFYEGLGVEFHVGTTVSTVDFEKDEVTLESGATHKYENLIVATGSTANRIPVDGHKLENIFVMRGVDDTAAIDAALGSDPEVKKNVVIVGSSFIGMEAALATSKRAKVSIVGMEKVPFELILGPEVGAGIQKFHEAQGTTFYLSASLSSFAPSTSSPSKVGAVLLKDGTSLPADLVILGVGVKPATALLKAAGLELERDGGVRVDANLKVEQVAKGNVFAVGDIAFYPDAKTGDRMRIEHWNVAANHARSVARTISGAPNVFDKVPVFWSAQGQQLRYAGSAGAKYWDDVIIQGDASALKFVAFYLRGDEVVAAASMQMDPLVMRVSELFALGKMLSGKEIREGKSPLEVALAK